MNSPLLQSGRLKFRLETNGTVMWLYAGGVSLILPDLERFPKIGSYIHMPINEGTMKVLYLTHAFVASKHKKL